MNGMIDITKGGMEMMETLCVIGATLKMFGIAGSIIVWAIIIFVSLKDMMDL